MIKEEVEEYRIVRIRYPGKTRDEFKFKEKRKVSFTEYDEKGIVKARWSEDRWYDIPTISVNEMPVYDNVQDKGWNPIK